MDSGLLDLWINGLLVDANSRAGRTDTSARQVARGQGREDEDDDEDDTPVPVAQFLGIGEETGNLGWIGAERADLLGNLRILAGRVETDGLSRMRIADCGLRNGADERT